ncbi:LOW QUALITY PROTEIN: larval serum protein 1 gamma chain [Drosophila busckii]|uniref:LOW QUALITY PROTEIN: larval serum protein 1 gamma chain n=1 Tax=Drosophila busckii TaxID=30019 RepID=UPI0014328C64|nr:LOW QUALITY PROTEIN: larval serum protein 1 gamma chain [Drosophila busckii]
MKLTLVLLALVGCVAAFSVPTTHNVKVADKEFLEKQKFLLEIVYRCEDPLMFEEYIKLGHKFVVDKSMYSMFTHEMEKFYESYKMGALLPKGEFFGALVKTHHKQAYGLFNFFYYAKNFEIFKQNVAWARMHVNEGMFIYALTLAVIHKPEFEGLALPMIYEIFPQYFFNSKFVYEAEKFDYDVWSKYIMYEKEYKDILYKDVSEFHDNFYFYTKDWKTWQWWKMMGLGEHWYVEDKYFLRENIATYNKDPKYVDIMKGLTKFYMPVDYTRDISFFNHETQMSYFTEDLGWNSFWYYLNLDYAFFLDGKQFGLEKDRRGEFWIYNVQQILARYYQERLSNGLGEIPEYFWYKQLEFGYDPQLIYYNGVGFSYRKNYFEYETYGNFEMLSQIQHFFERINNVLDSGYYKTADGVVIDLHKPEAVKFIGNYLQGNVDTYDKYFFNYYYVLSHMYFADVDYFDMDVFPHVFLNFETMMRDPFFYTFYKKFADVFYKFKYNLTPYTHEDLHFEDIHIKDVTVSKLVTYFDIVDFDTTNLLNDKMTFVDGKFVWDKTLMARQARLNQSPSSSTFNIDCKTAQKGVVRIFLGPKFDEYGRIIPLKYNAQNFVQIDSFVYPFVAGHNTIKRTSKEFTWTAEDRITYTELYKYVMLAHEGTYDFPLDMTEPHNAFPDRLVLPRGWEHGMPMQFYFFVSPYSEEYEQFSNFDYTYSSGVGSGTRFVDSKPFGYPFDRNVDEYSYFVSNGLFKDVKIYFVDHFAKYFEKKYANFGMFDYSVEY